MGSLLLLPLAWLGGIAVAAYVLLAERERVFEALRRAETRS